MNSSAEASPEALAERLLEILSLEAVEQNLFRAHNETRANVRLFGGQVLAQALRAACHTVAEGAPHSVHGYFLRAGNAARPVVYSVDRIRDGKSFTTRRVVAIQDGEAIFSMSVSFQIDERGFEHAHPMPNVPPPEELVDDLDAARALDAPPEWLAGVVRPRPFNMRSVFRPGGDGWQRERRWNPVWIRFAGTVDPLDTALNRALLAYASDMGLVSTATLPHGAEVRRERLQLASLDHALWIHRPVVLDDWLLFHKRTSLAAGSRGLVHAEFFDRAGTLLASVTQEGLVRIARSGR